MSTLIKRLVGRSFKGPKLYFPMRDITDVENKTARTKSTYPYWRVYNDMHNLAERSSEVEECSPMYIANHVFELIPNICTYCYKPSHQVSFHSFNLFIFNSRFYQFSFIASGNDVSVRYLLVNQNIILLSLEHDWFENNKDAFALDNSLNSLVEDHLSYSLEKKK